MGLVKEPDGIDFIIQSKPLSKDDEMAINKFIREYKEKHKGAATAKKSVRKKVGRGKAKV